jgi:heme/copper-type cytochrome/quinol oxidase subunit 2
MNRLAPAIFFSTLFLLPFIASAQINVDATGGPLSEMLRNILVFGNTVVIPFIIGIGFLMFVWGMFQYFIAGGANEESREKGKKLMISATVAFVVIIIFFGAINLLTTTTGLEGQRIKNIPQVTVPNN